MRLIDADAMINDVFKFYDEAEYLETFNMVNKICDHIHNAPTIDAVEVVRCQDCRKSHIDGKTTHYLWCTEWGRSTDVFGYCERGEREGE